MSRSEEYGFIHRFEKRQGPSTLLLLHGTGGDEADLLSLGEYLGDGAHLLSPRGRVREGELNRFFRRLRPGVFDEEDIKARAAELAAFVPAAAEGYGVDSRRVWAVGFSNGANIAASLLLLHPTVLAGAVLLRPMLPLEPDAAPTLTGLPVYIAAGRRDELIPQDATEALIDRLSTAGADLTVVWADGGHRFSREEIDAAKEWLEEDGKF